MPAPTKQQAEDLFAVHDSPEAESERQRRSLGLDSARTWVDPAGKQLSDRVWDARQGTRAQIDHLLRESIRTGEDSLVTAKKLEQFLDPSLAPIRTERGRLVRNQRKGIVTQAPGRGGSGSFAARRLARTEISRAHAQATELAGAASAFVRGLKWALSGSHPKTDPCDENARRDVGLGPGVYPVEYSDASGPKVSDQKVFKDRWNEVADESKFAVNFSDLPGVGIVQRAGGNLSMKDVTGMDIDDWVDQFRPSEKNEQKLRAMVGRDLWNADDPRFTGSLPLTDLSRVKMSQFGVNPKNVNRLAQNWDRDKVLDQYLMVYKWKDDYIVSNGHHRVVAGILSGNKTLPVNLIDLDAWAKKP